MRKEYHIKPGGKFNRLTAICLDHVGEHSRSYFKFQCDCGIEKVILGSLVVSGNTKSCGCLSREVKKAKRLSGNHTEITAIILGYKRHATRRGLKFMLSRNDVEALIKRPCRYCGAPPSNLKKTKSSLSSGLLYSGIDRVNSKDNYTVSNCVPCCVICNRAKNDMPLDKFIQWAKRLSSMAEQWGQSVMELKV